VYLAQRHIRGDGVAVDPAKAARMFDHACEMGDGQSCTTIFDLFWQGGPGFPKNKDRAQRCRLRCCDGGDTVSCLFAGRELTNFGGADGPASNAAEGIRMWKLGCEKGQAYCCAELGEMYDRGVAVKKDPVRARQYLQNARSLGWYPPHASPRERGLRLRHLSGVRSFFCSNASVPGLSLMQYVCGLSARHCEELAREAPDAAAAKLWPERLTMGPCQAVESDPLIDIYCFKRGKRSFCSSAQPTCEAQLENESPGAKSKPCEVWRVGASQ